MNIKKIQFESVYYGILLCIHITLEVNCNLDLMLLSLLNCTQNSTEWWETLTIVQRAYVCCKFYFIT